jgi:hypothetical protein
MRPEDAPRGEPTHVAVLATLDAPQRRRRATRTRRPRDAAPEPEPTPVPTGRATIIAVARPLPGEAEAEAWLSAAGEDALRDGVAVLNRALHAFRLASADAHQRTVDREQALVARIGFGAGEQVADGRWTHARELPTPREGRRRRNRVLAPQARLAALLGARELTLACEELVLRARLDLDEGRPREAALQARAALDAALAELAAVPRSDVLDSRLAELRDQREAITDAAEAALTGSPSEAQAQVVTFTVGRIETALRARAAAGI